MFSIADIDKETRKRLYGQQTVSTVEDAQMSAGSPMFTEEDVRSTQHCLDIILRSVFVSKRISKDFFSAKCHEYALSQGTLPIQANTFGSNLMRTLVKGNITDSGITYHALERAVQLLAAALGTWGFCIIYNICIDINNFFLH